MQNTKFYGVYETVRFLNNRSDADCKGFLSCFPELKIAGTLLSAFFYHDFILTIESFEMEISCIAGIQIRIGAPCFPEEIMVYYVHKMSKYGL